MTAPAKALPEAASFPLVEDYPWQISPAYNFTRYQTSSFGISMNGFGTEVTRYLNDKVGIEGEVGTAFGTMPANRTLPFSAFANAPTALDLVWYVGGPRIAYRGASGYSVWVRGLFGGAHAKTAQTGSPVRHFNSLGIVAGVGIDYKLSPQMYIRAEGNYLGTHFVNEWQRGLQGKIGVVFSF